MKRLLIVPILALAMTALAPAAYANHGGAQSPDIYEGEGECFVLLAGHGSCHVTSADPSTGTVSARYIVGVPTADGWHVAFNLKVTDNDANAVVGNHTIDRTIPYAEDWLGLGAPVPNVPFDGRWGTIPETTSASCYVDITAGTGGMLSCGLPQGPNPLPI